MNKRRRHKAKRRRWLARKRREYGLLAGPHTVHALQLNPATDKTFFKVFARYNGEIVKNSVGYLIRHAVS